MAGEDVSERLAQSGPSQNSQSRAIGFRVLTPATTGFIRWVRNLLVSPAGLAPIPEPHSLPSSESPGDAGFAS